MNNNQDIITSKKRNSTCSPFIEFLVLKDNIILEHVFSIYPVEEKGYLYLYGNGFNVTIGKDIRVYTNIFTGEQKPLEQQVKEGLLVLKDTEKIINNEIVEITDKEKIEKGLLSLKNTQILDGDFIRDKTKRELYDDNIISLKDYNNYMDCMRKETFIKETDNIGWEVLEGKKSKEEWIYLKNKIRERFPKIQENIK